RRFFYPGPDGAGGDGTAQAERRPARVRRGVNLDGGLVRMVKAAIEYTDRTGFDGLALSPFQLQMRTRLLEEQERRGRFDMARAVAAAMSTDEAERKALLG